MLQNNPDIEAGLPEGVNSVMEIIMNGKDMGSIINATQAAIFVSKDTTDLLMISAEITMGNSEKALFIFILKNNLRLKLNKINKINELY